MNHKITEIYNLLHSPIVTPHNLIDNAKLKNYEYVTYYKEPPFFVAEMKCKDLAGESTIFYYHFNDKDYLERIFKQQGTEKILIFDRAKEIEKQKKEFTKVI